METRGRSPAGRRRSGVRRRKRGVSDVVATIILLAMTVVLFSAIFIFVTSFPPPPAQSTNQFQAVLSHNAALRITGVNITHLAGPAVPGTAQVFIKSANGPAQCFSSNPVTVSTGIGGGLSWTLGQVWRGPWSIFSGCNGTAFDTAANDNLTVYIASGSLLLFSVILPGVTSPLPPTIIATWTVPALPTPGAAYIVDATIAGNLGTHKAYINLAAVPGGPATPQAMWFNHSSSEWQYNATVSSTAVTGTYYGAVNVTGVSSVSTAAAVIVTIIGGSSGSVALTLNPTTASHTTTQAITMTGTGYASATVAFFTLNGTTIVPASCSSGTLAGSTITVPANGTVKCVYTISKASAAGNDILALDDLTSGQTASAVFTRT
jgi:flagellin-like protein